MLKSRLWHHVYRLVVKWARTVHVYLTLFGFGLLLFFAVTGFMLNHEDMFLQEKQDGICLSICWPRRRRTRRPSPASCVREFDIEGLET